MRARTRALAVAPAWARRAGALLAGLLTAAGVASCCCSSHDGDVSVISSGATTLPGTSPMVDWRALPFPRDRIVLLPPPLREPIPLGPHVAPPRIPPLYRPEGIPLQDSVDVMVLYRSDVRVPRMVRTLGDSVPAEVAHNQIVADSLRDARAAAYAQQEADLAQMGARALERFWFVQGLLVRVAARGLADLVRLDRVVAVSGRYLPTRTLSAQPDTTTTQGVGAVTDGLGFAAYRAAGHTSTDIALFDTGVRTTHLLLDTPGAIGTTVDCFQDPDCASTPLPEHVADAYELGHGTASAGILVGDGTLGSTVQPELRGILDGTLHSYRVYELVKSTGAAEEIVDLAVLDRAFQHAYVKGYPVLLLECEWPESDAAATWVSWLANEAYDAGMAVIAPSGNGGTTLGVPGAARCVLGVGYRYVDKPDSRGVQSHGTTLDGRLKPDLQAWTNTITASNEGDDRVGRFSGTSGSAPYVAGAAAVVRAWLVDAGHDPEPGTVNAFLVLSGRYDPALVTTDGAGMIELPSNGFSQWGELRMGSCSEIEIPLGLDGTGASRIEAALWWPEADPSSAGQSPSEFRLDLIDPGGGVKASSDLAGSFERADVAATSGTWKLRIRSDCVRRGPRPVFWAAALRR